MRWYPPPWRERYGDEMAALLEDSYATAGEVPRRQRVSLAWSGLRERARSAGLVGWSGDPDARVRGGSVLVLCGWACYIVAGALFGKLTDRWSTESSHAGHWVATGGFGGLAVAWGVGCLIVLLGALMVVPPFVRLLAAGRWREVARPVVASIVSAVVALGSLGFLVARAHGMSAHDRNGGSPLSSALFVIVGAMVFVAVGCATGAAVSVARRVDLSRPLVRTLGVMAIGLVGVMALALVSLVTWWASEATHSIGFLSQSIGNGEPYSSSVVPPTLLATGLLMTLGLGLGLVGLVRIVDSLGEEGRAAA
jgi:hypothetical protein